MANEMIIDPEAVKAAADEVLTRAGDLDEAAAVIGDDTTAFGGDLGRSWALELGITTLGSRWYRRVHPLKLRLDDLAEFMTTNAANAEAYDAEDDADFVEFESELEDMSEYTTGDYTAATGEAPSSTADARTGEFTTDGGAVAAP